MLKKTVFAIINILSVLIIAAAVAVLCVVLLTKPGQPPNICGYQALRVTTGSMAPTYPVDTLLIVKSTPSEDIKVGDVISFYSTDPALEGAVNTHRVTAIRQENGEYIYTTRGDANNAEDPYDTPDRYLLGKTVYASVLLGKISRLVSNPLIFIPVILIPLAVILISNLVKTISLAKKIAKEEEEKAVKKVLEDLKKQQALKEKKEQNRQEDETEDETEDEL